MGIFLAKLPKGTSLPYFHEFRALGRSNPFIGVLFFLSTPHRKKDITKVTDMCYFVDWRGILS